MATNSEFQDSVEKTRETFRRAAEVQGRDIPPLRPPVPATNGVREELPEEVITPAPVTARAPAPPDLHPFFRGLLNTLPEPGSDWPRARRDQWLETARNIFALVYEDAEDGRARIHNIDDIRRAASFPSHPDERVA